MISPKDTVFKAQKNEEQQKLDKLLDKSNRIIYRTQTVFPFDLFPDIIVIDESKIEVITRTFFYTEQHFPILLKNVHGVTILNSIFFSSVHFEVTGVETDPGEIKYLWNEDAIKIKRIITGVTAAIKEGIDLSQIPLHDLQSKVEEIGKAGK